MHSHAHGNKNEKADWITNLGAAGEAIESAANFFFGATVYNTFYELCHDDENDNMLGWPLYIGAALGIISLGSAFTHRLLDTYHQSINHNNKDQPHDSAPSVYEQHNLNESMRLYDPLLTAESKLSHHCKSTQPTLTKWQKLALFGDATSHIFGRAGMVTGIVDGITETFTQSTLPPATRALIQFGSVIFGGATSASGIRTCMNTMLELNKKEQGCQEHQSSIHKY